MGALAGRRIVLGVTGGIAAYKAIEVCRRLVDAGAHVVPVMTKGAEHFVGRTTLSALASERPAESAVVAVKELLLLYPELQEGAEVDELILEDITRLANRHERITALFRAMRERIGVDAPPEGGDE